MSSETEANVLQFLTEEKSKEAVVISLHDKYLQQWQLLLESTKKSSSDQLLEIAAFIATKLTAPECDTPNETVTNLSSESKQKLATILTVTCCSDHYISSLQKLVCAFSTAQDKHQVLENLLDHLHLFCDQVFQIIPFLGKDKLLNLICTCVGVTASIASPRAPELLGKFTSLQKTAQDANKRFGEEKKGKGDYFSEMEEKTLQSIPPPEDFRELPVIPTLHELITEKHPFLRPNIVKGPYKCGDHYLDVQFRLLREDFVQPLRNAVQAFVKDKDKFISSSHKKKANRELDSSVRLYEGVVFRRTEKSWDNTDHYLFDLPERIATRINWDKSKRLLPGCLVMLTHDNLKTAIFAVTLSRPFDKKKKEGDGEGDQRRQELAEGVVRLSIETGSELVVEKKPYLMFECEAFFEAYRYNLGILQNIDFLKENEEDGPLPSPMSKFIVKASSDVGPPLYWTTANVELKLPIDETPGKDLAVSSVLTEDWPSDVIKNSMSLDADQYKAFQTALTSELAVIQGPPGTGKTYVGLQIVKTLLHNIDRRIVPKTPILILCYTNHALDQFLELLLDKMPKLNVVRVGGQSKSPALQNYTLAHHRKQLQSSPNSYGGNVAAKKYEESDAFRTMKGLEELLGKLNFEIGELSKPFGIFDFRDMEVGERLREILSEDLWSTIWSSKWLGVRTEGFLEADFRIGRIVTLLFKIKPKEKTNVDMSAHQQEDLPEETLHSKKFKRDHDEYDMDELLEHRLMEDEDESKNEVADAYHDVYLDKCSLAKCRHESGLLTNKLNKVYQQYNDMGTEDFQIKIKITQEFYLRGQDEDSTIQFILERINKLGKEKYEMDNRQQFFSAVFSLYNSKQLEMPDVEDIFYKSDTDGKYTVENRDVIKYPIRIKWGIYFKIVDIALQLGKEYRDEVEVALNKARKEYAQQRNRLDGAILSTADIIGFTTTGSAKMHDMLEIAKPQIVVVEEAAEILEAHVVTSLTEDCKQLILIGDHLQLRPSASIYELWKKYRLNISLFERMLLNGVPLCTLKTQHRMRPEISNLIIGPIYEELFDHEKVFKYPNIKGIRKNLFFINHNELEETDTDLLSKSNHHEANFLIGLCDYLLKQGYEPQQITILTTYNGQMFYLKKIVPARCRRVRITCVDNFQGEENDIILLSLVRSNEEDKVGFVAIDNRICVALSRAKHGLFVIGNMDGMVSASKTWRKIHKKLVDEGNIGKDLELVCEQHGNLTLANTQADFFPLVNGGCTRICGVQLDCSHTCPQVCHAYDQNHEKYSCRERCLKKCQRDHQCIGTCGNKCPPCRVPVVKDLPCGHQQTVPCSTKRSEVQCSTLVTKTLLCALEHQLDVPCYQDMSKVMCEVLVEKALPACGHVRMVKCDVEPEQVKCDVMEERKLVCGHSRILACHEPWDSIKCDVSLEKELKCGHKKTTKCHKSVDQVKCRVWVERKLPCGHDMMLECSQSVKRCEVEVEVVLPGCGHIQKLACFNSVDPTCLEACGKTLDCGHLCEQKCHATDDPDHKYYQCNKRCQRSCLAGHPCIHSHNCFLKCLPCEVLVLKTLECEHEAKVKCGSKIGDYRCREKVAKTLPCGHEQLLYCGVDPNKDFQCNFQIIDCKKKCESGHQCSFRHACYEECPPCPEKVEKTLKCGHVALLSCHDDGKNYRCTTIVKERKFKNCLHVMKVECYVGPLGITFGFAVCKELVQINCNQCGNEAFIECANKDEGVCKNCATAAARSRNLMERSSRGRGRGRGSGPPSRPYRGGFNSNRGRGWRNF